jgi:hypothetical protein
LHSSAAAISSGSGSPDPESGNCETFVHGLLQFHHLTCILTMALRESRGNPPNPRTWVKGSDEFKPYPAIPHPCHILLNHLSRTKLFCRCEVIPSPPPFCSSPPRRYLVCPRDSQACSWEYLIGSSLAGAGDRRARMRSVLGILSHAPLIIPL